MADSVKIRITGDASHFNKEVNGLGNTVKNAASGAGSVLKGMLGSQIITKGISMLTGGIRSAITTGMEFEASMSQVAAISGATAEELERLTAAARHYGETTKFTASQAASALNYMALAGWDVNQSLDALPGVLSLAAASGMELGAASDAVTDYISAFGMEAADAAYMADLMAYAQANANTSATQLADAYGNCASSMHAAGQDIETTTAMLMALSNQGIKGSEAGTQMAAVMRDLTQKMENGKISIGKTSVAVTDAAGNFRDLNDIMTDVGAAVEGMGTAERSAAIMETFTARSVKAVNTILNEGMKNVGAYEDALRHSTGTAADQASKMMDNLQGDVQIFQSALEGLEITASDSFGGVAREIVQAGTSLLEDITRGGKANGIAGMFDAVIDAIPSLQDRATGGLETLLGGIAARLPALVKKLAGRLPNLLKSGLRLGSTVINAVTEAAASAVETLASNLPEYIGQIFEALPDVLGSAFNASLRVMDGLFSGLDTAAAKLGLRKWRFGEILQRQLDSMDPELRKELKIAATVDYSVDEINGPTAEEVRQQVSDATESITKALKEAGIDESTSAAIVAAVRSGSGLDAFEAALNAWGVPKDKAAEIAGSVSDAFTVFSETFAKLGLSDEATAAIQAALDSGASVDQLKQMLVGYGVEESAAQNAATSLTNARDTMNSALAQCELDEPAKTALTNAATTNASISELTSMLMGYGVDQKTAEACAESLNNANEKMNAALAGCNLTEEADKALKAAADRGASVEELTELLVGYGVDEEEAKDCARQLADANTEMNTALSKVKLDDGGAVLRFSAAAGIQGSMMTWALNTLALSGVDTDAIADRWELLKTTIGGGFEDAVKALHKSLTNGIPDNDDKDFAAAKKAIDDYCAKAQGVIDEWEKASIAKAKEELTGASLESEITRIHEAAESMHQSVTGLKEGVDTWVEDTANKPADYVNGKIAELQALIEEVYGVDAKMRELDASVLSVNRADRMAVESGYITDPSKQTAAIAFTNYEYERQVAANAEALQQARAEAAAQYADDAEAYAKAVAELEEKYAAYDADAMAMYNKHMQAIMLAMLQKNPELISAINRYKQDQPLIDAIESYTNITRDDDNMAELEAAFGNGVGAFTDYCVEELGIASKRITEAADSISTEGGEMSLESLLFRALALDKGVDGSVIKEVLDNGMEGLAQIDGPLQEAATEAFDGVDWGDILAIWSAAAEAGILQNMDQYDMSDADGLFDYMMDQLVPKKVEVETPVVEASDVKAAYAPLEKEMASAGSNAGDSFNAALAGKRKPIVDTAVAIGKAAAAAIRKALGIASPSKVMMRLGEYTGEGFSLGLSSSLKEAIRSAQAVVGLANLRPRNDFSGLSGAFGSAVQTLVEADNQRPTEVYVNGRYVGRAMDRDSAQASAALNRRIGLGYGK